MFNKKPRRNFRQRKDDSSDEEGEQKNGGNVEENAKAAVVVNKPSKVPQNRGISCSSKRETTPPKADSTEEDEEALELTAERKERDGGKKKANAALSFSEEAGEPEFRLKKSSEKAVLFQLKRREASPVKTTPKSDGGGIQPSLAQMEDSSDQASPRPLHCDDNDAIVEDSDDDDDEKGDAWSSSSSSGSSCSPSKPVTIPKAKEIEAARRQRRAARAQKEFISLDKDGRSSSGSSPQHLRREDEEDRDDDDDDDDQLDDYEKRIEFAPRQKSIRERIAEKLGGSNGSLSGTDGEDQEFWEETQIGKGVKRRTGQQSPSGSESSSHSSSSSSSSSRKDRRRQKRKTGISVPDLPSVTVSMVKRRITVKLDSLKEVHRARQAELRRMEMDVDSARSSAETLEESSSELQLKFYRAMTLYVHNLVECLREKIVEINAVELELHTLLSDQMEGLLAQRRQNVRQEADRLQQLSYSKLEQSSDSTNGTETHSDPETAPKDFDIPEDTQPSAEEEEQLQKKTADILSRSQAVFSDVQDDFCDVKKILLRFKEWRQSYSDSYHSAYISLCLPKLLNPIIRHQLLAWNPLKDVNGDFENLPWFTAVENFCHGHDHEELEQTDRQTLSNIIERTLLPKLTAFVELVWDPMSLSQSVCLTGVCHRLKEDYSIFEGEQSKPVKTFLEAVIHRLRSCVDEDVFIPLYPKKFLEDKSSPQCRFRDQQFWTAIKLLGNMGKWDVLLPESVLKELMLEKLLNRYLMITLSSQTQSCSTVHACKKIADSLPLSWCREENVCLPQLQNFRNHLVQEVHTICKKTPPEETNTRSVVVEVLQVLSRIRCYDSIMAIAEKYHYEDVVYSHQLLNQETI
ncbi:intron Large complex component GCFC2 isoform X2 [Sphaeramia orbicularis]|uniref:intron Large complex component GCFC2 isoform X2 n=1 Tax=Sphaeramia orbicularis TaxID=375764 RepID=UPI0011815ABF|nr:GC-rich sequence DNA-binding factor 2 isoform X2 [Sphaeramia orbicularis]